MLNPEFVAEMKAKLEEYKTKLQDELSGLIAHTEVGEDEDENATEIQMDEANQDVIARIKGDLEKIDAAMARIESGTYGTTVDGQQIPEERLRAIPWADTNV